MDGPDRIGGYTIEREIGRGGMGVVYLANDPRLGRKVAIKALPEHLAEDPDRLARFDREARALASLSHPNVGQIYGVEEEDGGDGGSGSRRYLVLEYIEGETLEEALDRGALSVDDALDVAVQIARGVEAAHEAGVVHRDLKPGNVKVMAKGEVKVLDFGLAKATERSGLSSSGSLLATESPTVTSHRVAREPTVPGAIMGTVYYMSPEQARGRAVDARTDIWSLGVMLYEMLTGAGPFLGETATDVLGAILHVEPDWSKLPRETPATVQLLLRRCLQRDRKRRLQSMGDARVELEAAIEDPIGTSLGLAGEVLAAKGRRGVPLWVVLVLVPLLVAVGVGGAWALRGERALERLNVGVPIPARFESIEGVSLSPDGRMIAVLAPERVAGQDEPENAIYVREWSEDEFRRLPGTERAANVAFSPSGARVFFTVPDETLPRGEVRSVPVDGGAALRAYEWSQRGELLGWGFGFESDESLLVMSREMDGLYRVGASGGAPSLVARLDLDAAFIEVWGTPRSGGRFAIVTRYGADDSRSIHRVDLESGTVSLVLGDAGVAEILETGHVVFWRNGALWVAPFDLDRAEVTGAARVRLSGFEYVSLDRLGERAVYLASSRLESNESIVLVDSSGVVVESLVDAPADYGNLCLSSEGRRLAYTVSEDNSSRVWVLDIASGLARPVTPGGQWVDGVTWTPDGRIAYARWSGPQLAELMVQEATPGADTERLLPTTGEGPVGQSEPTFSPDGRFVVISDFRRDGDEPGVYAYDVGDGDSGRAFFASQAFEGSPAFRPDGEWVAYGTNGTGRFEVYLRPFVAENPESAPIYPVTREGGTGPMWSADGKTLYYRSIDEDNATLYAVTVETEPELTISEPRAVLTGLKGDPMVIPAGDGRFIMEKYAEGSENARPDIRLILNWGLGREKR